MPDAVKTELDKTTLAIVLYFISRLDGVLGKTHLQKLLFLTDLISSKKFKEQLTAVRFQRYNYGPYSAEVKTYTKALEDAGRIVEREFEFSNDASKKYTRYYLSKPVPIKEYLIKTIGPEKFLVLDSVVDSYGNMGLQELLDIVYSLPIMEKAKMNELLDVASQTEDEDSDAEIDF